MSPAGAMLPPGSTIGILGGGQLARMMALAAAPLGLKVHVYAPEADSPAFEVSAAHTLARYDDIPALQRFAQAVDVVTLEFENIPVATLDELARHVPVRPGSRSLSITQDRLSEKALAQAIGAETASHAAVETIGDLHAALDRIGAPAILKTRRLGYDGKGQVRIARRADADSAFDMLAGQPAIVEALVPFQREISVVLARGLDGTTASFSVTENEHRQQILHRSRVPALVSPALAARAAQVTAQIAENLDHVGVLAVEFFVVEHPARQAGQPAEGRLLVNEIAPRVHNSGHWTIEGAVTSQFAQHVRAVAGWPLGAPDLCVPGVEMLNLIGSDIDQWPDLAARRGASMHLYGKSDVRPGRKMGHVTFVEAREPIAV